MTHFHLSCHLLDNLITYTNQVCVFIFPVVQVEFNLSESQRTGFRKAVNVAVLRRNSEMRHKVRELFYAS